MVDAATSQYEWGFVGIIRNRSRAENTIVRVHMVVWKNQKRNSYLRIGHGDTTLHKITDGEHQVYTPLYFKPREALRLAVRVKSIVKGGVDEKLLSETIEIIPSRPELRLPKHTYQLCFEDIDGNYFDNNGRLLSIEEAELWFLLENTFIKIKENFDFRPLIIHLFKILWSKIRFKVKWLLWQIGL